MFAKETSILIFSYNRHEYLNQYLEFLNIQKFSGHIIISDASKEDKFNIFYDQIKKKELGFKLKIINVPKKLKDTISISMSDCIRAAVDNITTKYCIISADDDLVYPPTLEIIENYLNCNENYNSGIGQIVKLNELNYIKNNAILSLKDFQIVNPIKLHFKEALDRSKFFFLNNYHGMFSVIRSEYSKFYCPENYDEMDYPHYVADYNFIIPGFLLGPVANFKKPLVFRRQHDSNLADQRPFDNIYESIKKNSWPKNQNLFENNVLNIFKEIENVKDKKLEAKVFCIDFLVGELSLLRNSLVPKSNKYISFLNRMQKIKFLFNFIFFYFFYGKHFISFRKSFLKAINYNKRII